MAVPVSRGELNELLRLISSGNLYNRHLSGICKRIDIPTTGVKAELQDRIAKHIQDYYNTGNWDRLRDAIGFVRSIIDYGYNPSPNPNGSRVNSVARDSAETAVPKPPPLPSANHHTQNMYTQRHTATTTPGVLTFKPSPFYTITHQLGETKTCDIVTQHRSSASILLRGPDHARMLQAIKDTNLKVMVFCSDSVSGLQDIAFPHQAELRVNGVEVKANLRGLKNRHGSTRPVNITNQLNLQLGHSNTVELVYALTSKKFYFGVYICRTTPVEQLVATIAARMKISKDGVIREIAQKSQDPDVVATSQILSLKCPLTYARLALPCRSLNCKHIQCFDATSYLQLQEQGPQWLCPICNKSAPFAQLAVDEYASDILTKTPTSLDQVTIEPDGKWSASSPIDDQNDKTTEYDRNRDSEELIISEVSSLPEPKSGTPSTPNQIAGRPGTVSYQGSPANTAPQKSTKRPLAAVVDLTLSSDEDDEPIARPPKRHNAGSNSQGAPPGINFY